MAAKATRGRRSGLIVVAGVIVVLAIAGLAIFFGVTSSAAPNAEEQAATGAGPGPSAPEPSAEESDNVSLTLPALESLQVSSDQSDDEIARQFVALYSDWGMAGSDAESIDTSYEGDNIYLSARENAERISAQFSPLYGEAIFGPAYLESPTYEGNATINENIIEINHFGGALFVQTLEFRELEDVTTDADGHLVIVVAVETVGNSADVDHVEDHPNSAYSLRLTVDTSAEVAHLVGGEVPIE